MNALLQQGNTEHANNVKIQLALVLYDIKEVINKTAGLKESRAIEKIKSNPKYFYSYAKSLSKIKSCIRNSSRLFSATLTTQTSKNLIFRFPISAHQCLMIILFLPMKISLRLLVRYLPILLLGLMVSQQFYWRIVALNCALQLGWFGLSHSAVVLSLSSISKHMLLHSTRRVIRRQQLIIVLLLLHLISLRYTREFSVIIWSNS